MSSLIRNVPMLLLVLLLIVGGVFGSNANVDGSHRALVRKDRQSYEQQPSLYLRGNSGQQLRRLVANDEGNKAEDDEDEDDNDKDDDDKDDNEGGVESKDSDDGDDKEDNSESGSESDDSESGSESDDSESGSESSDSEDED